MKRARRRAGARARRARPAGAQADLWATEPKIPGSKDERWRVNLKTGKRQRVRARRAKGSVVNVAQDVKCPPWMTGDCERCEVCGEAADQVSFGITWSDGEEAIRQASTAGGGYRSRGPVLWAMHKLKMDAFELRHLECVHYAPTRLGGPFPTKLPEYLVWAVRFGSDADQLVAIERARRADVPDETMYQVVAEEIAQKAELVPF